MTALEVYISKALLYLLRRLQFLNRTHKELKDVQNKALIGQYLLVPKNNHRISLLDAITRKVTQVR